MNGVQAQDVVCKPKSQMRRSSSKIGDGLHEVCTADASHETTRARSCPASPVFIEFENWIRSCLAIRWQIRCKASHTVTAGLRPLCWLPHLLEHLASWWSIASHPKALHGPAQSCVDKSVGSGYARSLTGEIGTAVIRTGA